MLSPIGTPEGCDGGVTNNKDMGLVLLRQINEYAHINIFIRYTAIRCRTSGREGMCFSSRCLLRHRSEERTGH